MQKWITTAVTIGLAAFSPALTAQDGLGEVGQCYATCLQRHFDNEHYAAAAVISTTTPFTNPFVDATGLRPHLDSHPDSARGEVERCAGGIYRLFITQACFGGCEDATREHPELSAEASQGRETAVAVIEQMRNAYRTANLWPPPPVDELQSPWFEARCREALATGLLDWPFDVR